MKLKRAWPAILIWVVFVIFDIVMVLSYSFFSGLFPSYSNLTYSIAFTAIAILVMSIITFLLCRLSDSIQTSRFEKRTPFKILYGILASLIVIGGFWYRVEILSNYEGTVTGKMSLYENAMIGGGNVTPESDLLSIIYTALLRAVLFFTGNIISVPLFFQIVCFTVFMICGFVTVYKLLGMLSALVFSAYVAFMPVFTPLFTGLQISTDPLFMAMFGIELLLVAIYLSGAYKGIYKSQLWVIWYIFVGASVGYMAYVDAGTIIMILPFLLANLMLYGRQFLKEIKRFSFVILGAVITFLAMIMQEAGIGLFDRTLYNWGTYYFHNLNTFSTFWTYTDYKMIYLVTVVAMSGVIVGFWKNRKVEKISPWLLSMLLIFATVPFMGATRMNTQVFVTVYYAFILACVASLITLPENEAGDPEIENDELPADEALLEEPAEEEDAAGEETSAELNEESAEVKEESEESEKEPEEQSEESEEEPEKEPEEQSEEGEQETDGSEGPEEESEEFEEEPEEVFELILEEVEEKDEEGENESLEVGNESAGSPDKNDAEQAEDKLVIWPIEEEKTAEPKEKQSAEEKVETDNAKEADAQKESAGAKAPQKERFVPEGMVLPEDDEDADMTPHMNMPAFKGRVSAYGTVEKLKVGRPVGRTFEEIIGKGKDDFDLPSKPGDDFDI